MSKLVINKYSVDKKELSVIITFLSWLFLCFIIIFMGVNNVFAASYTGFDFTAQLYDNLGPTLNAVTTSGPAAGTGHYEGYIGYTAYSSGGAWGISSPITLIANHTYTLTANVLNECGYPILSTYNRIGVGTSLGGAVTSYQNNTNANEVYSKAIGGSNFLIQYAFTPTINASYIVFPFATSVSCNSSRTLLENITIDDLGIDGVTQDQINTSLNNQTNEINSSIQNSTDTIINNQNQNNEELKDTINENFNTCRPSVNLFSFNNYSQPQADTTIEIINSNKGIVKLTTNSKYHFVYVFINGLEKNTNYTFNGKFINSNENMKNLWFAVADNPTTTVLHNNSYSSGTDVTFNTGNATAIIIYLYASGSVEGPNEATWYDIQLQKGDTSTSFEPYGQEICSNKIDETNDKLDNLNGSLNNSNTNGATNDASNFFSNFTTDTFGLTSIITAPLSLINSLTSSSCSTLRLPLPYLDNKFLELPCMETIYSRYFGSFFDIYQTITFGIVAYWVIVRIFNQVKDFKNPDHDEIEVLDL